jgi:hypothetical protein
MSVTAWSNGVAARIAAIHGTPGQWIALAVVLAVTAVFIVMLVHRARQNGGK